MVLRMLGALPATLLTVLLAAGCTGGDGVKPGGDDGPDGAGGLGHPPRTGAQPALSSGVASPGWTVTVYYTAVADLHSGPPVRVTGCPTIDCTRGDRDLGVHPADFVKAVKDEGTGRTADGRYLNWSYDTGYWLDTAPRDTAGRALRPWESAAADGTVLRQGARFAITDCGKDDDGGAIPASVCTRMREARWTVTDEFTPGLGGDRHVDVYIGEETGRDFVDSPWYTTLRGATLTGF